MSVMKKELWLISFGDLVTVLVCLFVALMLGHRGKALAEAGGEHSLKLATEHFDPASNELSVKGLMVLKGLMINGRSKVSIESCGESVDASQLARTVAIARQFSVTSAAGSVTLSGAECAEGELVKVVVSRL